MSIVATISVIVAKQPKDDLWCGLQNIQAYAQKKNVTT
jgi:hypothetical protein